MSLETSSTSFIINCVQKYLVLVKQIAFFGVVGLLSLGIDVTITSMLYHILHFPPFLASAVGFLSAFFFNFPINRQRVFLHSANDRFSLHAQVVMFISLSVTNLFITSGLVQVIVATDTTSIERAKLFAGVLIAAWNFLIFKLVIFSKKN